jgi:antitoxin ParD1/3/4
VTFAQLANRRRARSSDAGSARMTNFVIRGALNCMTTMNISLPAEMKAFVDAQVADRRYGNASEYMRDLIRRDLARERFRAAILAGLESGPAVEWTSAHFDDLRAEIARAEAANANPQGTPAADRKTRRTPVKATSKRAAQA